MCKNYNVCILPLVIAVIFGIISAALIFVGTVATTILNVPFILGLIFAIITLILIFVTAAFEGKKEAKECVCDHGKCLALGAFLTLFVGILGLTFIETLAAGSIVSALIIGIFGFAFILNFLSFIGLVVCLIRGRCRKNYIDDCKYNNDCN